MNNPAAPEPDLASELGVRVENGVLFGSDGYLFLANGKHDPLGYLAGKWHAHPAMIESFRTNLEARAAICAKAGVPFAHIISPDKQSVLPEHCPIKGWKPIGQVFCEAIARPDLLCFPADTMRARPDSYHRTDTHFSSVGNVVAMEAYLAALPVGAEVVEEFRRRALLRIGDMEDDFSGDLGRRFTPFITETSAKLLPNPDIMVHESTIPGGNDGKIAVCFNPTAPLDKVLLVFGDSFFKYDLAPEMFRLVVFLRARQFYPDIFDMVRPDYVITQNVERYLRTVSLDGVAAPFFLLPFLLGRPPILSQESARAIAAAMSRRGRPFRTFFGPGKNPTAAVAATAEPSPAD